MRVCGGGGDGDSCSIHLSEGCWPFWPSNTAEFHKIL